jgi:hypothetical protein
MMSRIYSSEPVKEPGWQRCHCDMRTRGGKGHSSLMLPLIGPLSDMTMSSKGTNVILNPNSCLEGGKLGVSGKCTNDCLTESVQLWVLVLKPVGDGSVMG